VSIKKLNSAFRKLKAEMIELSQEQAESTLVNFGPARLAAPARGRQTTQRR